MRFAMKLTPERKDKLLGVRSSAENADLSVRLRERAMLASEETGGSSPPGMSARTGKTSPDPSFVRRGKEEATSVAGRIETAKRLWGWEPHASQREWLECEADVKVAACGRRWGKTEAAAYDAATWAIAYPGSIQIIVSPTYDQSKLIFNTVEELFVGHDHLRPLVNSVKTPYPKLTLWNRSVISARTADEDGRNLRGHRADRVIVDEAAYVRDAVVEEVISPMLADKNGKLILISTPFGKNHFHRAFLRGQEDDPRCRSFQFPSWMNPHISRDYIESQREIMTPRQFSVEYEAQFLEDQNSVFSWSDIMAAVAAGDGDLVAGDGERETFPVAGVDWGRYSDYTAVVVLDAWASPYRVLGVERFNLMSWEEQVKKVEEVVRRYEVRQLLMDQTSIGDPLLEQTRLKVWENNENVGIDGLVFTNSSKREVIDGLTIALSNRQLEIMNHEQLIKELQYYEYEITSAGNMRMNARRGYNDDLVIALALGVKAANEAPGELNILSSRKPGYWGEGDF